MEVGSEELVDGLSAVDVVAVKFMAGTKIIGPAGKARMAGRRRDKYGMNVKDNMAC